MRKLKKYSSILPIQIGTVALTFMISACAVKPSSDMDSPDYHHKAGMRHLDMGEYDSAVNSFSRAIDLDKKFAVSHAGLGVAHANLKDRKSAKKHASKAEGLSGKDPQVLALCGKVYIDLRDQEKKWHKDAKRLLKKALKRKKGHELATYYTGEMHLYKYEFAEAEDHFRSVVDMKGEHSGRADKMWQLSQKIVRAVPGTEVGKKVALYEKISRADLAAVSYTHLTLPTKRIV